MRPPDSAASHPVDIELAPIGASREQASAPGDEAESTSGPLETAAPPSLLSAIRHSIKTEHYNLNYWIAYSLVPWVDPDAQAFADSWLPPTFPIKITPWRTLNTLTIFSFGLAKAITANRGLSSAPSTLDWVLGVAWTLM
jgi:hypothetical protein